MSKYIYRSFILTYCSVPEPTRIAYKISIAKRDFGNLYVPLFRSGYTPSIGRLVLIVKIITRIRAVFLRVGGFNYWLLVYLRIFKEVSSFCVRSFADGQLYATCDQNRVDS